jgi:hypothetical protein
MTNDLLIQLRAKQVERHLTDGEMAVKLGCTRTWWNLVKHGKVEMGKKRLRAVLREFPELGPYVLLALQQEDEA